MLVRRGRYGVLGDPEFHVVAGAKCLTNHATLDLLRKPPFTPQEFTPPMSPITDKLNAGQDQILEAVDKIQGPVVDAVRTVAEKVEGILPENRPSVPFADSLPEPKELVEFYFGFSQKLLDKRHAFATAIFDAASASKPAPVKASKPASAKKAA
jgi:hypothetical protein